MTDYYFLHNCTLPGRFDKALFTKLVASVFLYWCYACFPWTLLICSAISVLSNTHVSSEKTDLPGNNEPNVWNEPQNIGRKLWQRSLIYIRLSNERARQRSVLSAFVAQVLVTLFFRKHLFTGLYLKICIIKRDFFSVLNFIFYCSRCFSSDYPRGILSCLC